MRRVSGFGALSAQSRSAASAPARAVASISVSRIAASASQSACTLRNSSVRTSAASAETVARWMWVRSASESVGSARSWRRAWASAGGGDPGSRGTSAVPCSARLRVGGRAASSSASASQSYAIVAMGAVCGGFGVGSRGFGRWAGGLRTVWVGPGSRSWKREGRRGRDGQDARPTRGRREMK